MPLSATPAAGQQGRTFYTYRLGGHEVTVVSDGINRMPLTDNYVKNAPRSAVNAALESLHMDKDGVSSPVAPIVVNTGSKLVVIDTGWGPDRYQQTNGAVGQFHSNLAAAGIDNNAVDTVIISHLHPDHINGLLTTDNKLGFPNAETMVPAAEWRFWMDDSNRLKAPPGSVVEAQFNNCRRVFAALDHKVTEYEPDRELVPGITSLATYGHSPGHTSHIISSGRGCVLVQGDVAASVGALFVRNPGWHAIFDLDGPAAEQTRRRIYDMAASEKILIQGFHFPFPGLVRIERCGTGYREIPVHLF